MNFREMNLRVFQGKPLPHVFFQPRFEPWYEKRPVSVDAIEEMANRLEARLLESGEKEISGHVIGEWIMHELHDLDEVAYVRFASVYKRFNDIDSFIMELDNVKTWRVCK